MNPSRRPTARISMAAGIAPSATPRLKPLIGSVASDLSAPSRYSPARPPRVIAIDGDEPATADDDREHDRVPARFGVLGMGNRLGCAVGHVLSPEGGRTIGRRWRDRHDPARLVRDITPVRARSM